MSDTMGRIMLMFGIGIDEFYHTIAEHRFSATLFIMFVLMEN